MADEKEIKIHPADSNGDGKVSKAEEAMYLEFKRKGTGRPRPDEGLSTCHGVVCPWWHVAVSRLSGCCLHDGVG